MSKMLNKLLETLPFVTKNRSTCVWEYLRSNFHVVALLGWALWKKMQNYPENLTLKFNWNPYLFINLWQKILTVFLYIVFDQTLDILNQKRYYFSSKLSPCELHCCRVKFCAVYERPTQATTQFKTTGLQMRQKYFKTAK